MDKKYNSALIPNAKDLRKNMTKEERHLWYDYLRTVPQKVVRQKVLGKYIADFYCASAKLVIELDGSQHYEDKGIEYDISRTPYLESFGIRVVRIPNNEINENFEGVCEYLETLLNAIPSVTCGDSFLAVVRSPRGSEMPPAFHSTPLGRFATLPQVEP